MRFESNVVVSALVTLERQLVDLRHHFGELAAAFGRRDSVPAAMAAMSLRCSLDGLAITITTLKPQVVEFDRELAGETVESLGELALRATTLVVTVQLDQVCDAIREAAAPARAHALFAGRFRNVEDVAAFVREELARINGTWMRYRKGRARAEALVEDGATPRRILYRDAIRTAQQAIAAIGQDPDLAHFLREGAACVDWPEVHTACVQIAVVIGIKLGAEPDPALFDTQPAPPRARDNISTREP